jgi:hypothetical protein
VLNANRPTNFFFKNKKISPTKYLKRKKEGKKEEERRRPRLSPSNNPIWFPKKKRKIAGG